MDSFLDRTHVGKVHGDLRRHISQCEKVICIARILSILKERITDKVDLIGLAWAL